MAIPKVEKQNIIEALKYIDENGVPSQHQSTQYELVVDGKKYPPKYVIAVANHLANGGEITTVGFDAAEAKNFLQKQGFTINMKRFTLTISATEVASTEEHFPEGDLSLGDNYAPVETFFRKANGEEIRRKPDTKE